MKIIHLKGFTTEERLSYRDIIHSNVIMSMRSIINAADKLKLNNISESNKVNEKHKHRTKKKTIVLSILHKAFITSLLIIIYYPKQKYRKQLICLLRMKFYLNKK